MRLQISPNVSITPLSASRDRPLSSIKTYRFCGKSGIFQFIRALLSMREFSTHQSLNGSPFMAVPGFTRQTRIP